MASASVSRFVTGAVKTFQEGAIDTVIAGADKRVQVQVGKARLLHCGDMILGDAVIAGTQKFFDRQPA
jgi:hypothetical protein